MCYFGKAAGKATYLWVSYSSILRELAVTSLRLIVSGKDSTVVAAKFIGKLKTVLQIVCIVTLLLDRAVTKTWPTPDYLLSYIAMAVMTIVTLWSGYSYLRQYWSYIDINK